MKTLIIDNYDSFTYNLFQQVAGITKCIPEVYKNDEIGYDEIVEKNYDAIIISPGPGRPEVRQDFGVCTEVLLCYDKPVLGVCLGHQGIGYFSGGEVIHAPEPIHGRLSGIYHNDSGLFKGLPQGFNVVRYHSLVVAEPLPKNLKRSAWTKDGILMGIEHETKPHWGIQYHPESISTEFGNEIIARFFVLAEEFNKGRSEASASVVLPSSPVRNVEPNSLIVDYKVCDFNNNDEVIFYNLFGHSKFSFWLDSSKIIAEHSRFSIMGSVEDSYDKAILFERNNKELSILKDGKTSVFKRDLFEYLAEEVDKNLAKPLTQFPFNFNGGFIGYFGYELKSELDFKTTHDSEVPDAALIFSSRFLVIDHKENKIYLVAIAREKEETDAIQQWVNETFEKLHHLKPVALKGTNYIEDKLNFYGSQNHSTYIDNIKRCLTEIKNGESYEICLTNQLSIELTLDPVELYLNLRKINPAQYSAFLHFDTFSVVSSSPEQFLKLDRNRNVSTKPIKGTIMRDPDPLIDEKNKNTLRENEKFQAENLMIVDLLRNDLGRVCEIGSVSVPHLMAVETYQTLNHLVSTVVGKLESKYNVIDLIKATFPGGSITGAPKKRTMEIIDRLEKVARGPYTGSIGYISSCGSAELNIIIRTAVLQSDKITIGSGGAIIALSDPQEEFDEILLKAFPLIKSIVFTAKGAFDENYYSLNLYSEKFKEYA
ncbi:MAG: aminodeoxychorismate synthase, component [Mucilaginibacter sp.]|nr:aminodeoxychorismate synthase, component [Mucilaginibacter sp.]